jgi:riboflavin synthase
MFTGLIEAIGTLDKVVPMGDAARFYITPNAHWDDVAMGDSIAIDGVCLTVVPQTDLKNSFAFDLGPETLKVSALGGLQNGDQVHLERALRLGDRLGGHLVQGHVDGIGELIEKSWVGETLKLRLKTPMQVLKYCIHKGSITMAGVSLTINTLHDDGIEVWLIPHTLEQTKLGKLNIGDTLNLEADMIGKYVERLFKRDNDTPPKSSITWETLAALGQQNSSKE